MHQRDGHAQAGQRLDDGAALPARDVHHVIHQPVELGLRRLQAHPHGPHIGRRAAIVLHRERFQRAGQCVIVRRLDDRQQEVAIDLLAQPTGREQHQPGQSALPFQRGSQCRGHQRPERMANQQQALSILRRLSLC